MSKIQNYVPSIRCPECGGVVIRTTQTRKQASGIRRKHLCKSMVRRLGEVVECGHKFESRQDPPSVVVAPVDKILIAFFAGKGKGIDSEACEMRNTLAAEGIETFPDLVDYIKANIKE